jgi:hypothetical protein
LIFFYKNYLSKIQFLSLKSNQYITDWRESAVVLNSHGASLLGYELPLERITQEGQSETAERMNYKYIKVTFKVRISARAGY